MIFVRVYARGEVEMPDGDQYLMVVSEQIDAQGDWIPSSVETFKNDYGLWQSLKKYRSSGEPLVIHAPKWFHRIAGEMGLPVLSCEWGGV